MTQDDYFRKRWNVLDFTICMLCIISFIVTCIYNDASNDDPGSLYGSSLVSDYAENENEDSTSADAGDMSFNINDVDMVLLLTRYVFQSIRLCRFLIIAANRRKTLA